MINTHSIYIVSSIYGSRLKINKKYPNEKSNDGKQGIT
jgi:hypothetical protein